MMLYVWCKDERIVIFRHDSLDDFGLVENTWGIFMVPAAPCSVLRVAWSVGNISHNIQHVASPVARVPLRGTGRVSVLSPVCAALGGYPDNQPLRGCKSSHNIKPIPDPSLKGREKPFLNPSLKGRTFIALPFRGGLGWGFHFSQNHVTQHAARLTLHVHVLLWCLGETQLCVTPD